MKHKQEEKKKKKSREETWIPETHRDCLFFADAG